MSNSCFDSLIPEPPQLHIQRVYSITERDHGCLDSFRSIQWRINLGILPRFTSSIDDIRRATAEYRRRYACLRRQLLTNPHHPKDDSSGTRNLIMDNPLSQNPDSIWGRFFQNAELEKMVDQDLCRLCPQQHHPFFQTPRCQYMVRRILLLWCLAHPHYSYMQGMHELLTPLLYVLHTDIARLSEVRKNHGHHFPDNFDTFFPTLLEDDSHLQTFPASPLTEPDPPISSEPSPEIHTFVLLGDFYGADGELGSLFSNNFIEHDAYSMFEALLTGAVINFFSPPLVIEEASLELYRLLSAADPPLHAHLLSLAVEPQYFSLRWLRLLFGREFSLSNLLLVWDRILAADNSMIPGFSDFRSGRVGFITAVAVAMLINIRGALLASDNATTCLQRVLNFPERVDVEPLLETAMELHRGALEPRSGPYMFSPDRTSPKPGSVPESYWEEQWKVVVHEEEQKPTPRRRWSEMVRSSLARVGSDPTHMKSGCERDGILSTVRRNLLEDMSRESESEEDSALPKDAEVESSSESATAVGDEAEESRCPVRDDVGRSHTGDPVEVEQKGRPWRFGWKSAFIK